MVCNANSHLACGGHQIFGSVLSDTTSSACPLPVPRPRPPPPPPLVVIIVIIGVKLYSYESSDWIEILVDDQLAVKDGDLEVGGLGEQKAIWPALLQKAGGRYIGSFAAMDLADSAFAFGMLTGETQVYGMDEGEDGWTIYKYKPITSNQPHDYDWMCHYDEEADPERVFPASEVMGVCGHISCGILVMAH